MLTVVLLAGFIGKAIPPQRQRHSLYEGQVTWNRSDRRRQSARAKAYAPYSKFLVGAAVQDERGKFTLAATSRTPPIRKALRRSRRHRRHDHGRRPQIAEVAVVGAGDGSDALRRLPAEICANSPGRCDDPYLRRGWHS